MVFTAGFSQQSQTVSSAGESEQGVTGVLSGGDAIA